MSATNLAPPAEPAQPRAAKLASVDANFLERTGTIPKEYISDWIAELQKINIARINTGDETIGHYMTKESIQYIFALCVRLRLPTEVRYVAAFIFDTFMRLHTRQMFIFLAKLDMDKTRRKEEWEKVETNMSRQLVLRICSCIQIASKDVSYHDSLSSKQICSCLRSLGCPYTKKAVLKSELRIFKTLDFRIPITPLVYAESLLKTLSMKRYSNLDIDGIWSFVCVLLDVVCIERDAVYHKMISYVLKDPQPIKKIDLVRMQNDWMHLGSALVTAAACCQYGFDVGDPMAHHLEEIGGTPSQDIRELAIAIIEIARGAEEKKKEMNRNTDTGKNYISPSSSRIIGVVPMHAMAPSRRRGP